MQTTTALTETDAQPPLAGKYMTFRVGNEEYGVQILKVRELVGLLEITRVPNAPPSVKGVVNLRGRIIPVVDLRAHLGMSSANEHARPVIIVAQLQRRDGPVTTGVLVDQVLEVRNIAEASIEPPPSFGGDGGATRFILGIAKTEKRVVLLIDIDLVLSEANLSLAA
jgi:purine-binding chemotaxis protein CheW